MTREQQILTILYEMAMVIGGETSVKPLLTKTLQRLLYHTSFPAGLAFLDLPADAGAAAVEARMEAAVGDHELGDCVGRTLKLPAALLRGGAEMREDAALLEALPCQENSYLVFLRLPIGRHGAILLLSPTRPTAELPLARIFQPVMANLGKAILLCRSHEAYTAKLVAERDAAKLSLREKEMLVQELSELAARDGLTGLYNHRSFYILLTEEIARAQRFGRPVSLLMLDVDHFKRVNDTHGHPAGDAILRGLSELLGCEARAIDRICRYGGEEIAVILPETDLAAAAVIAERLRAAVEMQPFKANVGLPFRITVSIGAASWPMQADSAQALVAAADVALYAAKQGGRNRVIGHEAAAGQPATRGGACT